MRNILATVTAVLAVVSAGASAHAATYENAGRLVAVMGLRAEIERAIGDSVAALRGGLQQQGWAPEKIDQYVAAFRDELEAGAPDFVREMTRTYADRFSDAEIDDLVRFYETPTGQKLVSVQRELATAQVQAVANWIARAAERASEKLKALGASV